MQLSTKAIKEFKELYLTKSGELLSDEKANSLGVDLLTFFQIFYKPIPKEWYDLNK